MSERTLIDKLQDFFISLEDEYWDAHDIIYEDYLHFKNTAFLNPFIVLCLGILRFLYHLSTFTLWIGGLILYFTIWDIFVPLEPIPDWWEISYAVLFMVISLMFFGITLSFKQFAVKKNRRKNKIVKKISNRLLGRFQK
jgi:hypothetical protein